MTPFLKFVELMRKDRARFETGMREANFRLFAAWDAERAKGRGGLGPGPDDASIYDDINSKTYSGRER